MAKSSSKKKKQNVFRFINKDTGEHYTIRLSKKSAENLADKGIKKFSKSLKRHVEFTFTKKVK
jgi:hypothetical protein